MYLYSYSSVLSFNGHQIGINYIRKEGELKGCINDANNIKNFLISTQFLCLPSLSSNFLRQETTATRRAIS